MAQVRVDNVWKVFGKDPEKAIRLAQQDQTREQIRDATGSTVALAEVDFEVNEGELFVLMGLSGCGKSTLIRCINRLHEPTKGKIWVGDTEVTAMNKRALREFRRNQIGMVFQHVALLPHKSVLDNVAYGLEIQGMAKDERHDRGMKALESVQLANWAHESPASLSGGMKQRVGVARALTIEPEILLMDEPFSALDPLIRTDMQEDLEKMRQRVRKTILFVTHDLDEALTLGDRIAIMREGRIVALGGPSEIAMRPDDEYVERFVEGVNRSRVLKANDILRQPRLRLKTTTDPRLAVRRMEEHSFESAFVVHRDGQLAGVITIDRALEGARVGLETIEGLLVPAHTVDGDTPVEQIVRLALEHRMTIAVVDADGVLEGIVRHKDLLPVFASLASSEPQTASAAPGSKEV
jgi:glycine betaine/proline transport system ATP-binding protein